MNRYASYQSYKNSGYKHLSPLPSHWTTSKVKFVTNCQDGKRIPLNSEERSHMQGDYPYWGANGILDHVNDWIFDDDLILVGEDGAPFFDDNKDVAFRVSGKVWVNNHAHILKPKPAKVSREYLTYALNRVDYHLYINGSTRDKLTQGDLGSIIFEYPPLHEQTQIAAFLDRETVKIDSLIEKQQRLIELLGEKRQAVISHAVTKGLNPDTPMKDSGVGWLGDIPQHWNMTRLKYISPKIGVGLVINPSTYTRDEGLHFIFGGNVVPYGFKLEGSRKISEEDSLKLHQSRLKTNDIVTVRVGAPGVTAVVDEKLCDSNCASVMIVRRGNFNSDWLCACMNSPVGMAQVKRVEYGAAQKQFNISDAIEFAFPTPPVDEQDEIAEYVCVMLNKFDKLISTVSKQIHLLQERRTALISAAVTGKIDVRDQLPQDVEEAVAS